MQVQKMMKSVDITSPGATADFGRMRAVQFGIDRRFWRKERHILHPMRASRIGATILGMNPTAELYDYATAVLASRDFFNRSTSMLEEDDSQFRPAAGIM